MLVDLSCAPWPWEDSSIEEIRAHDIIEHLPNPRQTMHEIWRVLQPGGKAEIVVPTSDGRGAFQDPTHLAYPPFNRNSFFYYTDGDPHRKRFGEPYGIKARFRVISERTDRLPDEVVKLSILLEAVK